MLLSAERAERIGERPAGSFEWSQGTEPWRRVYSAVRTRPTRDSQAKGGGRFYVGWGRDVLWLVTHGARISPSVVCCGVLLQDGRNFRAVAIRHRLLLQALTVLTFNFLGNGLRDAAEPSKR